jgi:DNA polymerase
MDVTRQAAACQTLDELRAAVARCEACELHKTRNQTVFSDGEGGPGPMFIGEAPGADEDAQGIPFVGRAGKLLTDIIVKGMGLPREKVTIANVLKCRPPENRDPTVGEKKTCTPWLDRQVDLIDPKVLIPLGRHAAMHVLEVDASMGSMRGTVHERRGRKVVATYHPAYLLRSPGQKKECWKDIQLAMTELGLPAPDSKGSKGS